MALPSRQDGRADHRRTHGHGWLCRGGLSSQYPVRAVLSRSLGDPHTALRPPLRADAHRIDAHRSSSSLALQRRDTVEAASHPSQLDLRFLEPLLLGVDHVRWGA